MSNGRILIVESNLIVACDLAESLELAGYEVCSFADGGRALRRARFFRPELAIVDADASGASGGPSTALKLREEHGASVVFLTAHSWANRPSQLAATLPLAYLEKPFDSSALLATAAEAIAMHRIRTAPATVPTPPLNACPCAPTRETALVPLTP